MADSAVNNKNGVSKKVNIWEQKVADHRQKQLINPFSEWEGASHRAKLSVNDESYGKPVEGSRTEWRGQKANQLVGSEIITLLKTIKLQGAIDSEKGLHSISFGNLFELYTRISNKVVGILLRARKYGLVDFEGEMLFQRQHDLVVIGLTEAGNDLT